MGIPPTRSLIPVFPVFCIQPAFFPVFSCIWHICPVFSCIFLYELIFQFFLLVVKIYFHRGKEKQKNMSKSEKNGKTKYCKSWKEHVFQHEDGTEETFSWVLPAFADVYKVLCDVCKRSKPFSIANGGIADCKQHAKTATHQAWKKQYSSQRTIGQGPSSCMVLNPVDLATKAEMLQAMKMVESNLPFASANGDSQRFKLMFPDSEIAHNYHMEETKAKYMIQFGMYPHLKNLMKKDIENMPFSFLFDETTTSQTKKQYDGYATYVSKTYNKVITTYAGSLFVGHCKDVDLLDHFFQFMKDLELNTDYLIGIGMDGPSVNKSFERKLINKLEDEKGNSFLCIGSCVLHTVNNAFAAGMKEISEFLDIEQFLSDLFFFFKYSSARREDYRAMEELTNVTGEYLLNYCSIRWLYIGKVVVRLLEQIDNVRQYFLTFLPQQRGFAWKSGVGMNCCSPPCLL